MLFFFLSVFQEIKINFIKKRTSLTVTRFGPSPDKMKHDARNIKFKYTNKFV